MPKIDHPLVSLFDPLREKPNRAGIFLDFDGTLSPIVPKPSDARLVPGAVEIINRLAARYATVAVISGRPIAFLQKHMKVLPTVRLCGLYGLQRNRAGKVFEDPAAAKWRSVVDNGATTAQAQLPRGVRVERKGLTFALHYRGAPEHGLTTEEWAARFAASTGLNAQRGRLSVEIGPFHQVDKGTVVTQMAEGLNAACFFGDDSGDLPAFCALDKLTANTSLQAVKVLVHSPEAPAAMVAQADCEVSGPGEALELLRSLLDRPAQSPSHGQSVTSTAAS